MPDLSTALTQLSPGAWPGIVYGDFSGRESVVTTASAVAMVCVPLEERLVIVESDPLVLVGAEDRLVIVEAPPSCQ